MGEAAINLTLDALAIQPVAFCGVTAEADVFLYEKGYAGSFYPVLASLYGSESACRAIFAALAQYRMITVGGVDLAPSCSGIRCRGVKVGYGKYHYVIWREPVMERSIIFFDGDGEQASWERFLAKRKIPFLTEWIPHMIREMVAEEMVRPLSGFGAAGYLFDSSDEAVCNLIVERIHT